MVPAEHQPFFTASVAASAALIGGREAAQALSAFTALANIFFISLTSLIPGVLFGLVVMIIAIPAVLQTLALLLLVPHWRATRSVWRGAFLFLASAVIYSYELVLGSQLWRQPSSVGSLVNLLFVILGASAIGLGPHGSCWAPRAAGSSLTSGR